MKQNGTFSKGEKVYLLQNWDHKGTVNIVDAVVMSAGKYRMTLATPDGRMLGRDFLPIVDQYGMNEVQPATIDAEARALGRRRFPRGSSIEIVAGGNVGVRYPKQTVNATILGEARRYGIETGVRVSFRVADGRTITAFYTYEELDLRSIGIVP